MRLLLMELLNFFNLIFQIDSLINHRALLSLRNLLMNLL
jgi:hypothetical protein